MLPVPVLGEGVFSSWAQYTLKFENRDHVMNELKKSGIPSVVYFSKSMSNQRDI